MVYTIGNRSGKLLNLIIIKENKCHNMYLIRIKLNTIMKIRNITLTELSEKTGLTISNLSNIKNNRIASIRFSTLEKLCKVLDCQPCDILVYEVKITY